MSARRTTQVHAEDTMRLMTAAAAVVAVLSGVAGAATGDGRLLAVAVAFAAMTLYLYARWQDVTGRAGAALLGAAVVVCAAACIGLAVSGYWWFAACLSVPTGFGVVRWTASRRG